MSLPIVKPLCSLLMWQLAYFGVLAWYRANQNQPFSDLKYLKIAGSSPNLAWNPPREFRALYGSQLCWSMLQTLIKQWPTHIFPNSSKMPSSQNHLASTKIISYTSLVKVLSPVWHFLFSKGTIINKVCCYTTCKYESLFQNCKQPYHSETCFT